MLRITMDRREVDRLLAEHAKQAPYAVMTAINETLKAAQRHQRGYQRDVFQVRNARFLDQAVKIKPFATKKSLFGIIQIDPPGGAARRDILTKFEAGGTKTPRGRSLTIPKDLRVSRAGVPEGLRPGNLNFKPMGSSGRVFRGDRRTFLIRTGRGGLILQRTGNAGRAASKRKRRKGANPGKYAGVRILYVLTPSAHIDPLLHFEVNVMGAIARYGERALIAGWAKAVRSAR